MKITIIGSGLLGITTAYFLSQQGQQVVVLDRQNGPGLETSYANGGMLTPSQAEPWNSPGILSKLIRWLGKENSPFLLRPKALFSSLGWGIDFIRNSTHKRFLSNLQKNARLASYSLQILRELRRQHHLVYDETSKGTIKIFDNEDHLQQVLELTHGYKQIGIPSQVLNPEEVLALEPALSAISEAIAGGIYYPDDEAGDAYKFCQVLATEAENNGVEFMYGVDVKSLEYSGDQITGIDTSAGFYRADCYVLTAGSFSPLLARTVNLKLPVRPVKGYSLTLELNGWDKGPSVPIVDESMHIAVTPLGARLRIAGTAEFGGYDLSLNQSRLSHMLQFVRYLYPDFIPYLDETSAKMWAGLRPYTSDGVPIIGNTCYNNLFLNTGHGHLGWSMAPGSGRLVSDLILGNNTAMDLSPYSVYRW